MPALLTRSTTPGTFGAVFAEVRVDAALGTAYAAGRVLNRKTARSQHIGAITYGLAMALHEHTAIDPQTGRYVNADLSEYLVRSTPTLRTSK
jgi:xanthine dehydrogenase YagR molybdenum-binding subunit